VLGVRVREVDARVGDEDGVRGGGELGDGAGGAGQVVDLPLSDEALARLVDAGAAVEGVAAREAGGLVGGTGRPGCGWRRWEGTRDAGPNCWFGQLAAGRGAAFPRERHRYFTGFSDQGGGLGRDRSLDCCSFCLAASRSIWPSIPSPAWLGPYELLQRHHPSPSVGA